MDRAPRAVSRSGQVMGELGADRARQTAPDATGFARHDPAGAASTPDLLDQSRAVAVRRDIMPRPHEYPFHDGLDRCRDPSDS
jgi:hypothetical protein